MNKKIEPDVFKNFALNYYDTVIFVTALFVKVLSFNTVTNMSKNSIVHYSIIGTICIILFLILPLKRKTRFCVLISLDIILSILIFADLVYFRYYSDVMSVPVFFQAKLLDTALFSSIGNLINLKDSMFFLDVVLILILETVIYKKKIRIKLNDFKIRSILAVLILALGIAFIFYSYKEANKLMGEGNKTFTSVFDNTFIVSNIGVLNYHAFDAYSYVNNTIINKKRLTASEKEGIKKTIISKNGDEADKKMFASQKNKNLIIVQVESMQNLVMDLEVSGNAVTPNLNEFKKKCLYFPNCYAQVAGGNTADAEFITNNSLYPARVGSVYFRYVNNQYDSIANNLKKQNYSTYAMHAYKPSFWNRANIYPSMGFDKFYSKQDYKMDDVMGWWGLKDQSFLRQSADIVNSSKKPLYSFLVTLTSHYPFSDFSKTTEFSVGEKYQGTVYGDYLKSMNYVDKSLGMFIKNLEDSGVLNNSILVIYGDHEGLKNEDIDKIVDLNENFANKDIRTYKMKNIPLMLHLPDDVQADTYDIECGQIDIMPTLSNLMGLSPGYCLGQDLLNSDENKVIFRNGSVLYNNNLYEKSKNKVFDINTGEEKSVEDENEILNEAQKELGISDEILENNLIKDFED